MHDFDETKEMGEKDALAEELQGSLFQGKKLIHRFILHKILGQGGMGMVWEAEDTLLKERVALKIVDKRSCQKHQLARIIKEVTKGRTLRHPNLVRYFELFEDKYYLIIAMERVQGTTLDQYLMEKGTLSLEEIKKLLQTLRDVLAYLHQNQVIHRDIKPSNIFITPAGDFLLGDLGILRETSEERLTLTASPIGTPYYMAPEALRGKAEYASDYYSLGMTLYECLTGEAPFSGTQGEVMEQHLSRDLPPLPSTVPSKLRHLVRGLGIKDPKNRFGSKEIDRYLCNQRLPFLPKQKEKMIWAIGGLLFLGLVIPLLLFLYPSSSGITRLVQTGHALKAYGHGKLLWEKKVPENTQYFLEDDNGDGKNEAVIFEARAFTPEKNRITWYWKDDQGKENNISIPMKYSQHIFQDFSDFYPFYTLNNVKKIEILQKPFWFIHFVHHLLYPSFGLLIQENTKIKGTIIHPGYVFNLFPNHHRLVFYGIANPLLHQKVLLITQDLSKIDMKFLFYERKNSTRAKGIQAYHLLSPFAKVTDAHHIYLPSGKKLTIRKDGSLSNQPDGAGVASLQALDRYVNIRLLIFADNFPDAEKKIQEALQYAQTFRLSGWEAIFSALQGEVYFHQGLIKKAFRHLDEAYQKFPYHPDFIVLKGFYHLILGQYKEADQTWRKMTDNYGFRLSEIVFYRLWLSFMDKTITKPANEFSVSILWAELKPFLPGWEALMSGDFQKAQSIFKPALKVPGGEFMATGYFLASYLSKDFDDTAYKDYLKNYGAKPPYLMWVGALGEGNMEEAQTHWNAFINQVPHVQDYALMYGMMRPIFQGFSHLIPSEAHPIRYPWQASSP